MNLAAAKSADRILGSLLGLLIGRLDGLVESIRPPTPVEDVRRILVVKFWGLGNWALLRPIVRDLRRQRPDAQVTIATLAGNRPLVEDLCDELLLVRADATHHTLQDLAHAVGRLRRDPPDLALDFEQFARSGALLARLGGARQRIGFRTGSAGRDGLYTVTVPFGSDVHAARSFRDLAEAAGLPVAPVRLGGLPTTSAATSALTDLDVTAPYVVLHPGSGDNFPGRRWSVAGFAAAGRAAHAEGRRVYVTGGASERGLAARVARGVGAGAVDLSSHLDVPGLVALLAGADALLANDTGPVHIASQLGTPVLAVYGPNTPVLYGPLSEGSRAFYRDLPCSPCITAANYRSSRCRIHTCMASIPTGEVVTALRRLLREGAPRRAVGDLHEA